MKYAALKEEPEFDVDTEVPSELFDPVEFFGADGVRFTCGVAALRILGSVTVVISETLYDAPANLVKNNFAAVATQCYHERLPDVEPWRIRWLAHYTASDIHPMRFHEIRLDWVPDEVPGGCFGYARWRTLSYREARSLLADMRNEVLVREALQRAQREPTPLRKAKSRFAKPIAATRRSLAGVLAGWLLEKLRLVAPRGEHPEENAAKVIEPRHDAPVDGAAPASGEPVAEAPDTAGEVDRHAAQNAAAKAERERMMAVAVAQHDYDDAVHAYFAAPTERNFARLKQAYDTWLDACGHRGDTGNAANQLSFPNTSAA